MVLYTIIFLQFKYRIINYWKYSMIFFIASMCSKFFRIIFTVLIGWSVFDLIPNICSYDHSIFLVGWLVWFDLVWFGMWTLFTFSNKQLEMNSPYFGSEKGDLFLVLSPQIFLMSNHIQWTRYIIIYILDNITELHLSWFIYWFRGLNLKGIFDRPLQLIVP